MGGAGLQAGHRDDRTRWSTARSSARVQPQQVFWSEMDIGLHETRCTSRRGCDLEGPWMRLPVRVAGPIYAGTNEIQRNIIAERLLGLPRK